MAEAAGIATDLARRAWRGAVGRPRYAARRAGRPRPAGRCGRGARGAARPGRPPAAADHHDRRPGWRAIPGAEIGHRFRLDIEGGDRIEGRLEQGWGGEARLPARLHPGLPPAEPGRRACHRRRGAARAASRSNDLGAATHRGAAALGAGGADLFAAPPRDMGHRRFRRRRGAGAGRRAARRAAIAVSPAHALFAADVGKYGPYSPSSRILLNVLHADPTAALGASPTIAGAGPDAADRLARRHAAQAGAVARAVRSCRRPSGLRRIPQRGRRCAGRSCAVRGAACASAGARPHALELARLAGGIPDAATARACSASPATTRARSPSTPSANGWRMPRAARRSRRRGRRGCRSG